MGLLALVFPASKVIFQGGGRSLQEALRRTHESRKRLISENHIVHGSASQIPVSLEVMRGFGVSWIACRAFNVA